MNNDFQKQVLSLEQKANKHSVLFNIHFIGLLILGYLFLGLLLFGGIAVSVLLIYEVFYLRLTILGWFAVASVGFNIVVIRSLWVKKQKDQEIELSRSDAPKLYAEIDHLRKKINVGKIQKIIINHECNASIEKKWLFFNRVIIGLPLLLMVSQNELRSILAHELGHFSDKTMIIKYWILRNRLWWIQLFHRLKNSRRKVRLMRAILLPFISWYVPKIDVYSFVQGRRGEYLADKTAVDAVGKQAFFSSLLFLMVHDQYIDTYFWTEVNNQVEQQSSPPADIYSQLFLFLQKEKDQTILNKCIKQIVQDKTSSDDVHPSIFDRASRYGFDLENNNVRLSSSGEAELLLGDKYQEYLQRFNQYWYNRHLSQWKSRHDSLCDIRKKMDSLSQSNFNHLSLDDRYKYAYYVETLDGSEKAEALYNKIIIEYPKHEETLYALAKIAFNKEDNACLEYVEKLSCSKDYYLCANAYNLAYHFCQNNHIDDMVDQYDEKRQKFNDLIKRSEAEREKFRITDKFVPVELGQEEKSFLFGLLSSYGHIKKAYLLRKEVQHMPQYPFMVVAIKSNISKKKRREFMSQFKDDLNNETNFNYLIYNSKTSRFFKLFSKIEGAEFVLHQSTKK